MVKVAVVGVGGVSGAHIPAWLKMNDAELVAICDIVPSQMDKYPYIKHYINAEEMLKNEKLDILDICLPTHLHVEYAIKAMNMGINVLCEKPISLDAADVDRVYECAEKNNVKCMVAQVLRFWPEYEFIKNIYDTKIYGDLLSGTMSRIGSAPTGSWDGWMLDEKRSGLVPFDRHIHDLDFLVYAFGTPKKVNKFRNKRPEQDYINAVYEYDGFFIDTEASWYAAPYPFSMSFCFQFETAVVEMRGDTTKIYEQFGGEKELFGSNISTSKDVYVPQSDAYANEIRYFTDCVKKDKNPDKVTPESLKTVINILRSL